MSRLKIPLISTLILFVGMNGVVVGQIRPLSKRMQQSDSGRGPTSNAINDIIVHGQDVWIAAKGISHTWDYGVSWNEIRHGDGLGRGSVSAFAAGENIIWAATAFDTTTELGDYAAGGGIGYSTDEGATWTWLDQPVDDPSEENYVPTINEIQNVIYDIALTESDIWIASFLGGLRKSNNLGETWEVVTVDGFPFNARGPFTHQVFSVHYDGDAVWVGTAGGIHKSTDNGDTWTMFNHQNQPQPISGNFVVAIGHQSAQGRDVIWAATIEALEEDEFRAVSKSEDGGLTWSICLEGEFAHNFAFDDSVVYVATDNGLYKSIDFGETWAVYPQIVDEELGIAVYTTEMYSAGVGPGDALWVGTADGLALTLDDGWTWQIFRAFQVPGESGTPDTYAYPNPFSPLRHNEIGGDGHVRFQYRTARSATVTVRVFDFGMNLVRKVVDEKPRPTPGDHAEVWDGKNGLGDMVANGVYFYRIDINDDKPLWGKVMVVN